MDTGLHVLELRAAHYLGLTAVEIPIGEDGLIVSGDNDNGKSAVLSILEAALGGSKGEPAVPIQTGSFTASIGVVLGRDGKPAYKVDKVFEMGQASKLIVTEILEEGAARKVSSPQTVLNGLYEAISWDPDSFIRADTKKQVEMLLRACPLGIDLGGLAALRKKAYEDRTAAGRDIEAYQQILGPAVPEDQPVPPAPDIASVETSLKNAAAVNAEVYRAMQERAHAQDKFNRLQTQVEEAEARLKALEREREAVLKTFTPLSEAAARPRINVVVLEAYLRELRTQEKERAAVLAANAVLAQRRETQEKTRGFIKAAEEKYKKLTATIEECDARKMKALADAQFPVPGMGLDESLGVVMHTPNGVIPFAQVNTAGKYKIAFGILTKLHPKIKVAVVKDGNAMDNKTIVAFRDAAREAGFQPFIERIAQDQPGAVVMEAFAVARRV